MAASGRSRRAWLRRPRSGLRLAGAETATPPLLSGSELAQLERLSLPSMRAILAGVGAGRAERAGAGGPEFADYRPYTPGDDLRHIDWNVYARLEELIVKVAPEERHLRMDILVDTSRSMDFGAPSKLWHARRVAVALGAIALVHSDAVRLYALGDGRSWAGARLSTPGMLGALQAQAAALPAGLRTDLLAATRAYRGAADEVDLAVLISDALVEPDAFGQAIGELAGGRAASTFVHVLDASELALPLRGRLELRDSESGERLELDLGSRAASTYERLVGRFQDQVQRRCRERGVRYLAAPTDLAPLDLLASAARGEGLLVA